MPLRSIAFLVYFCGSSGAAIARFPAASGSGSGALSARRGSVHGGTVLVHEASVGRRQAPKKCRQNKDKRARHRDGTTLAA